MVGPVRRSEVLDGVVARHRRPHAPRRPHPAARRRCRAVPGRVVRYRGAEQALGEDASTTIRFIVDAVPPAPTYPITGMPAKHPVLIGRTH